MSSSSKPKSRPPAHQNRTAFHHNKNSRLTKRIAQTATKHGLCAKCADKQEWRVKYRKYKPLTAPHKCNSCSQRTVTAAYRTICTPCASSGNVCASCGKSWNDTKAQSHDVHDVVPGETRQQQQEDNIMQEALKSLTERQRRSVLRRQDRGEDMLTILSQLGDVDQSEDSDFEDGSENGDRDTT